MWHGSFSKSFLNLTTASAVSTLIPTLETREWGPERVCLGSRIQQGAHPGSKCGQPGTNRHPLNQCFSAHTSPHARWRKMYVTHVGHLCYAASHPPKLPFSSSLAAVTVRAEDWPDSTLPRQHEGSLLPPGVSAPTPTESGDHSDSCTDLEKSGS